MSTKQQCKGSPGFSEVVVYGSRLPQLGAKAPRSDRGAGGLISCPCKGPDPAREKAGTGTVPQLGAPTPRGNNYGEMGRRLLPSYPRGGPGLAALDQGIDVCCHLGFRVVHSFQLPAQTQEWNGYCPATPAGSKASSGNGVSTLQLCTKACYRACPHVRRICPCIPSERRNTIWDRRLEKQSLHISQHFKSEQESEHIRFITSLPRRVTTAP